MLDSPIAVAGHLCLDLIPSFAARADTAADALIPGKLVEVGPATLAPGGAVANVGLALRRLGVDARLLGKVGDDGFGRTLTAILEREHPALTAGMIVATGAATSYSVVISQPGRDRIFLHCSGANDAFSAADVSDAKLEGLRYFHFGYPPLMRAMYQDDGRDLATLLARVKARGVATSLDMARPDPASAAGQIDWRAFLRSVLPTTDLFLPSIEEILFMLDRPRFEDLSATHGANRLMDGVDGSTLSALAEQLLAWGAAAVALKLGDHGLYLRTTAETARLVALGATLPLDAWRDRELLAPCFQVTPVGTTGAGDCAIAGLLQSLLRDATPEEAMIAAAAVGACSVEQVDATSGVTAWPAIAHRLAQGWPQVTTPLALPDWRRDADAHVWLSPRDRGGR